MSDYIPQSDAEFNLWQANLVTTIQANATAWGISAEDIAALIILQTAWATAFAKSSNKKNRSSADVQAKDDAREEYEGAQRKFIAQWLASNSKVSNSDRERMGLTVKSDTRTPVSVPDSNPVCTIDFSIRLQHTLHFFDEATPGSKAKPDGVHGCEIWIKTGGDAPKTDSDLDYLATCTRTPYVATFEADDLGKTVYYRLRWVNTRGKQGPWSSIVNAVVAG